MGNSFNNIAKEIAMDTFDKDEAIYMAGDKGHEVFIIIDGKVDVLEAVKITPNVSKKQIQNTVTMLNETFAIKYSLKRGDWFGEDSLIEDSYKYKYSAYAKCKTICMVVSRDSWKLHMNLNTRVGQKRKKIGILKNSPGFEDFSDKELRDIFDGSKLKNISTHKIIFSEGQLTENLF